IPRIAHNKMAELLKKSSISAVFFLGILVGLCEFPCTGGPYLMVLGLLRDSATYVKGLGYLIWYNLLFILPLAAVLLVASDRAVLEKLQAWKRNNLNKTKLVGGLIMIALGVLMLLM
ncbi:MAG: cytochrome c biogenesis protein CcdA, partial [Candidatus Komeilibacteria bacterium]|nr:cytochrome c biogenesis protein CcdA [Candidatus Komeilibacteria bacterium]